MGAKEEEPWKGRGKRERRENECTWANVHYIASAREREREREGLKRVGLLTFFSTESVDIDFVHPEYDVTGLDLQKQQTPFLWKRILQKDQLVRYDELPCTARGGVYLLHRLLAIRRHNSLQPPGQPANGANSEPPLCKCATLLLHICVKIDTLFVLFLHILWWNHLTCLYRFWIFDSNRGEFGTRWSLK